ncbi:MAG: tyrosine-type recombinase/integrase, partial [Gemmatimonadales bacterium]
MLAEIYPRAHARFASLPLLGPHLEGFVGWLCAQGYPRLPVRLRVRETPRLDARLYRSGIRRLEDVSAAQLLGFAPRDSQDDVYLAALVRSLARYLDERGMLTRPPVTPREQLVAAYRAQLERVRGLADSTLTHHCATASALLTFVAFDRTPAALHALGPRQIEAFVRATGTRLGRASLQHVVAHLRSFLRFLASRDVVARELDTAIDTPRLYRGEQLPHSLPWETVRAFLAAIDRSTPMGRRDYAMFLLITTYGLRSSEVAALRLDDIAWRAGRLQIPRPKAQTPLALPLTQEVGAALLDYLRHARLDQPCRHVFLRVRAPRGPLAPTAVTEAFQGWTRRGALPI